MADHGGLGINGYRTLMLTAGAARADQSEPIRAVVDRITGRTNIVLDIQTEWVRTHSVKGFAWNASDTTRYPDDGVVQAGGGIGDIDEWRVKFVDLKSTAGCQVISL